MKVDALADLLGSLVVMLVVKKVVMMVDEKVVMMVVAMVD